MLVKITFMLIKIMFMLVKMMLMLEFNTTPAYRAPLQRREFVGGWDLTLPLRLVWKDGVCMGFYLFISIQIKKGIR